MPNFIDVRVLHFGDMKIKKNVSSNKKEGIKNKKLNLRL